MLQQSISVSRQSLALGRVATKDGQMRGFVLQQGILGYDIVGQAGKIFCRDRVFSCHDRVG